MNNPSHAVEHGHKSTTHEEMYFHIKTPFILDGRWIQGGTVFFRKENDGVWYGSVARCSHGDQFNRFVGRNVARRRYFQAPHNRLHLSANKPKYEDAVWVYERY